jgi:hypothetical protein
LIFGKRTIGRYHFVNLFIRSHLHKPLERKYEPHGINIPQVLR